MTMARVSAEELAVWNRYVDSICGVQLPPGKEYLIETRLHDLLNQYSCSSFSELYYRAKSDRSGELDRAVIDRITTNETSFFRDQSPFDMLRNKILPDLVDRRKASASSLRAPLRIWSAACSNGQEVYTIAMIIHELLPDRTRFPVKIIGTDISNRAIATASRGIYNAIEMQRGLPQSHAAKYFSPTADGWKIADEIRAMVSFRNLNLIESFSFMGAFDVIFCRNVAIYFSESARKSVFDRLGQQLADDGYLVIGSTESITGLCPQFCAHRHLRSVFYQKL